MDGLKILIVNDSAVKVGGVETVLLQEREYLTDNGYTVRTVGLDGGADGQQFTDVTIPEVGPSWIREVAGLTIEPRIYRRLRSEIRAFEPDVIHVHKSQKYPATVALATRGYPSVKTHHDYSTVCPSAWGVKQDTLEQCKCGVGAKCWQHGCRSLPVVAGYYFPRHKIQKPIERRIIDKHIAPGATLTQYLTNFGYAATQVKNPQPVSDTGDAEQLDDGFFLFLGRLTKAKGVEVLVEAATRLEDENQDIDIRIAGTGPLEDELTATVSEQCPDTVELLGYISEERKFDLYRRARAVIVPSIWLEAFGMVVLEAMVHGTPVIGSDRGGVGELVDDGTTGLLYPATDSSKLAESIESLDGDPELAGEYGEAGREWVVQNHSYEKLGAVLEAQLHAVDESV